MSSVPSGEAQLHAGLLHHVVNTLGWPGLRPLQKAAVEPILAGSDVLLLAPTAGGKTEAALFPLLSAMAEQRWTGLSVLYITPLRALLNNLEPRVTSYAGWLGRSAALWHGDTGQGARQSILRDLPDVLLTTPESLEAMLVSTRVPASEVFASLRAVVVDEVHAFAGDDRGWHLLAVLERLSRLAGTPLQRIGLSATVGNPAELLRWIQGRGAGRAAEVVTGVTATPSGAAVPTEITLDYVGTLSNAARVIASLHHGEKRLVFCESRRVAEEVSGTLRVLGVTTFVSHSSLSRDERRRAEEAFSEARDCVIVSTSTLELGVDVGDLDRVIQIDAPGTVASYLQRLGRTGRRSDSTRNMLFLATNDAALLRAAAILHLWGQGWVEPVVPPPSPRHVTAQQLLGLCLQQGAVGASSWAADLAFPTLSSADASVQLDWLLSNRHLERDGDLVFVGPEAEKRYGQKHFLDLVSVFTSAPEFTVVHGQTEVGSIDPSLMTRKTEGPRRITLGGRGWVVTSVDWKRRRCYVEPGERGRTTWSGGSRGSSFQLTRAVRDVLLGAEPPVEMTRRALDALGVVRDDHATVVDGTGTVVQTVGDRGARWWTWAGTRANATLAATLPSLMDASSQFDDRWLALREGLGHREMQVTMHQVGQNLATPAVAEDALAGLKFSELLPPGIAATTLGERLLDESAREVLDERVSLLIADET